jgi:peptide/nickel transport system permease protein
LTERKVLLKHVLKNSLIPIITVFANIFPAAVGGSVILESIFAIPGMGKLGYEAILNLDYPIIMAVFTVSGALTILGYIVADILYALVDPRISLNK